MPAWHYSVGEAHQRLATETNTITGATIGFNTDLLGTYTPGSTGTDPRSALTARLETSFARTRPSPLIVRDTTLHDSPSYVDGSPRRDRKVCLG